MNFDRKLSETIFGKTLSEQLVGSPVSTDGLRRFTTDALLAELRRRTLDRDQAEVSSDEKGQNKQEVKVDSWLAIDEVTAKFFKGMMPLQVATYLGLIGHPYRLQPKVTDADFSVRKIFLEDAMKPVAEAFDQNSQLLSCDGEVSTFFHPYIGRYERTCVTKWGLN